MPKLRRGSASPSDSPSPAGRLIWVCGATLGLGSVRGYLWKARRGETHLLNQPFQIGYTSLERLDVAVGKVSFRFGPLLKGPCTHVLDLALWGGRSAGRLGLRGSGGSL